MAKVGGVWVEKGSVIPKDVVRVPSKAPEVHPADHKADKEVQYRIPKVSELANLSENQEQDFVEDDDHDQEP